MTEVMEYRVMYGRFDKDEKENLVALLLPFTAISIVIGEIYFISDYGAYPNDNIDDSNGIQSAVNTTINERLNSTFIFGYGIYNLSSTINITNATNLTIIGQGIDETFLIGNNPMTIFMIEFCEQLTINSLSIDFDPLPFTAGYIIHVNNTSIDIKIQPPHRADMNQQVGSIMGYDPIEIRPAFGPNTYVFYPTLPINISVISVDIIRLPLTSSTQFNVGDAVVARYANRYRAIYAHSTIDLTIQSVNIYASWFMDGRWLSTVLDCMNFANTKEYINIFDSKCETTGDDGLNVHSPYLIISDVINSTTLFIQVVNSTDAYIDVGTRLEFSSHTKPFTVYATAIVTSFTIRGPFLRLITLNTSINASIGDWICDADPPQLTIRNFTVQNNRAHGVLLETRNVDIRNSIFNRTSAPAIQFQPSFFWNEGPTARNVTLINNLYINCNEGIGQDKGVINITPHPIQLEPIIHHIRIESSTFYFGNYSRGFLLSRNANNVYITGNYISTNNSDPFISICNSRNITANNNTVINSRFKIDQYYTYDTLYPCQRNLSSLIDLPPSAFNSSFPPPVIKQ